MQKKLIFFSTVITLFFAVLFLDQNNTPVPVKVILGEPRPIGLSSIIGISFLLGVLVTVAVLWLYKSIRKVRKNQQLIEKNID